VQAFLTGEPRWLDCRVPSKLWLFSPVSEVGAGGQGVGVIGAGRKDYQHHVPPEWLTSVLFCDECGREYPEDRDECPDCGCLDAELLDTGGGPGRFWGYRGLRPVLAIRQVSPAVGIAAGRVLRRWYHAKRLTKRITVQRVDRATGRIHYRRCRKRKQLLIHNRGFIIVNDGPAVASQLAKYLNGVR
jgi:hypothetical protein